MHEKMPNSHKKTINLKYQLQRRMKSLNYLMEFCKILYLMVRILYQILKIILNILSKKHEAGTDNPPIGIYVNQIENRIKLRIKQDIISSF